MTFKQKDSIHICDYREIPKGNIEEIRKVP